LIIGAAEAGRIQLDGNFTMLGRATPVWEVDTKDFRR
jgi:hypothetical protein